MLLFQVPCTFVLVFFFFFFISRSQVETFLQLFAHAAVEPYASFKSPKDRVVFDNAPTPGLNFFNLANASPRGRRGIKMPNRCPGGWARLELIDWDVNTRKPSQNGDGLWCGDVISSMPKKTVHDLENDDNIKIPSLNSWRDFHFVFNKKLLLFKDNSQCFK